MKAPAEVEVEGVEGEGVEVEGEVEVGASVGVGVWARVWVVAVVSRVTSNADWMRRMHDLDDRAWPRIHCFA